MKTIDPRNLFRSISAGAPPELLDVRTPGEFEGAHIEGARLHPSDEFDIELVVQHISLETPLVVICQSGPRAVGVEKKMTEAGFEDVSVLKGGVSAWVAAGHPVIEGQGAIGMDRQMRIVAGSLVLIGIGLGAWVGAAWFGLSAFVGAGLVFAGVTDCCPMTSLLAKLPWNREGALASRAMLSAGAAEACCSPGGG